MDYLTSKKLKMKFEDFNLYRAIYNVYNTFELENKKPRSADWLIYKSKRKILRNLIINNLIAINGNLYSEEEILKAWDDFGKNKEKCRLIIETGVLKGFMCYKSNCREKCSEIISIENLASKIKEEKSPENCRIVCKKHLSEFIKSG